MKRILINATHNEEIRVALCKGNHMYDFDLENRTREQKKSNIYKAHVTRVEPSLEAVFVEYGAERQGFLPIREIAKEYLAGNPRTENIRELIKEGDTLIVQVEKEERGNKGAALSTFISLAGRYLVLMPNNPRGGGISRQISGKQREEMKRIVNNLQMPKGMSVIIRTAGIGKSQEDLQHDLDHLLNIWAAIGKQDSSHPSPRLVHQEAGVVTRALRDYMRDDIAEIWIDSANAYDEAEYFIKSVMPKQSDKLRKYTDSEPMFASFGIEKQIETAYQREVRLPSGGSIVIDQTEAMVAIDINSAKSTKGSDVAETAYHTNLEAAEEIARQLRLRDMGGLVVIDFIDMYDNKHQKEVEKRLIDSTKQDRARVQFGEISKFGLMEMSRQRLRPSLEESTGYKCPRCHGTGMIRDLRSLGLSIMRQIEQVALTHRQGEVQAEVPTELAAFLLNEKRDSLVYLEQDSGTRITILPHAHMESPDYKIHFNPEGFAPSSYERISDSEDEQTSSRGYEVNWQTADNERPEHQPTRQPKSSGNKDKRNERTDNKDNHKNRNSDSSTPNERQQNNRFQGNQSQSNQAQVTQEQPKAVAWLSNLFAPTPQAQTAQTISSQEAAEAIETIVNNGGQSLGSFGQVDMSVLASQSSQPLDSYADKENDEERQNKSRKPKHEKGRDKKGRYNNKKHGKKLDNRNDRHDRDDQSSDKPRREPSSRRDSRGEFPREESLVFDENAVTKQDNEERKERGNRNEGRSDNRRGRERNRNNQNDNRNDKRTDSRNEQGSERSQKAQQRPQEKRQEKPQETVQKSDNPDEINLHVSRAEAKQSEQEVVHLSLDKSKPAPKPAQAKKTDEVLEVPVSGDEAEAQPTVQTDTNPNQAEQAQPKATAKEVSKTADTASAKQASPTNMPARADGRANNDPRVVRAKLAKQIAEKLGVSQPSTESATDMTSQATVTPTASPITGSVGEFLRSTLDNAEERIEKQGVIACFIEAVAKHKQGSAKASTQEAKEAQNTNSAVDTGLTDNAEVDTQVARELAKFDFSNYGYEGLTTEYLAEFTARTASAAKFSASQGKTETAPTPIGKRASNDPRGQHPDFVESVEDSSIDVTETTSAVKEVAQTQKVAEAPKITDAAEADSLKSSQELPAEIAKEKEMVADKDTISEAAAAQQGVSSTETASDDNVDSEANAFADAFGRMLDQEAQTADAADGQDIPPSAEQNNVDDKNESVAEVEPAELDTDDAEERTKTTFDKYKSMLANVSEQLSGQSGTNSLFLSTPSVPKSRSRKKDSE